MALGPQIDHGRFADPALAGSSPLRADSRFSPALEAEYTRVHLLHSRGLIRLTCLVAAVLTIVHAAEHMLAAEWAPIRPPALAVIIAGSIALVCAAHARAFPRLYLPLARIIVPARNSLIAVHVADVSTQGGLHELMILPLMLVGPFFFLGLRFRAALVACALTVGSFVAAAALFGLPAPTLVRITTFLALAGTACAFGARHLELASRQRFLEGRAITELAEFDGLTGTKNRRVFDEHLNRVWALAIRERSSLAVILIDVDHFKAYNDRYGHQAGDLALRRVAGALQPFARRPRDILARYGGEEFAVVLYGIDAQRAATAAEAMRRAVEDLRIEHEASGASPVVTLSAGAAAVAPKADRKVRAALQLADQALYAAKRNGRNRVEVLGDTEYQLVITGVFAVDATLRAVDEA